MFERYNEFYIGYYNMRSRDNPIIICCSDNLEKVIYYLNDVRGLCKSQYEINRIILDKESAYDLYEDYILEEFNDSYLYLTNMDIYILAKDVENEFIMLENLYEAIRSYRNLVKGIKSFRWSLSIFDKCISVMCDQLTSSKNTNAIIKKIVKNHEVTNPSIIKYLQYRGVMEEDRELTKLYFTKIE